MLLKLFAVLSALAAVLTGISLGGTAWLWAVPLVFCGSYVLLLVLAFLVLWAISATVRTDVPQEKDDPFFRRLIEVYVEGILGVLRMKVVSRGLEQLPGQGRFLLVCNHLSLLDVLVLLVYVPRRELTFITKQENMSMFIIGKLMHKIQCLPLDRNNDRQALKTVLKAISLVKEDKANVGLFPEGTRSLDGKLHHFRSGGFKIAQKCSVPIVVCTIRNTDQVFRNFLHLKSTPVELNLLEVIPPQELMGIGTPEIADRVRSIMAADLGPGLVAEE